MYQNRKKLKTQEECGKKGKMKKQKGITLIALVITIIVLLILAAVSIAMLTGENGILRQATSAKNKTEEADTKESIELAFANAEMESYFSDEERAKLIQSELEKRYGAGNVIVTATATEEGYTVEIEGKGTYNIYKNGEIRRKLSREGLKVGDYIDYTPGASAAKTYSVDTLKTYSGYTGTSYNTEDLPQDTLNWRILRINDDGSMDLISDLTSKNVCFKGSVGYNNEVYLMNDICEKLYSNTEKGIKARSINRDDMEKWLKESDKGEQAKADSIKNQVSGLSGGTTYIESVDTENNRVTYKKNYSYYPILWKIEQENSLKESDKHYTSYDELTTTNGQGTSYNQEAENLTVENTYYNIAINQDNYGDGASVLSNSNSYWVASRCVCTGFDFARFRLCYADTNMYAVDMFHSSNNTYYDYSYCLRAVVSLGSEVQVTPCVGINSSSNKHTINW